jgi:two-component system OmpR family sensor kinase
MSCESRTPERPPVGRLRSRLRAASDAVPLGMKLAGATVSLMAVALVVTGAAGIVALRGYLVDRVDGQLLESARRVERQLPPPAERTDGNLLRSHSSTPSGLYVRWRASDGRSRSDVSLPDDSAPDPAQRRRPSPSPSVGAAAADPLRPAPAPSRSRRSWRGGSGGRAHAHDHRPVPVPYTDDVRNDGHDWRAVRFPMADGSGQLTVAISLNQVEDTADRLLRIDLAVGLTVLLLVASLAHLTVRTSLRRLREVESTAGTIAGGDLRRRVREGGPRTELGRLAGALNAMLTQIEGAFEAREESAETARASEERMRRFVADASHELRTPLTSIRGFAELYRQGAVPDRVAIDRVMGKIEDEAVRMGLLVDDLMLLARLDQQRPLERAPVDLVMLAADAVEATRLIAPGHVVRLRLPADPERIPPPVLGDAARLRQVVGNLLSNAITHTPAGTRVVVRLDMSYRSDPADPWVVIEVADTGPGLTAAQTARIFERFYRTDPARTRAHGGSGLGLSIVAALVTAHGGEVRVVAEPGQGAVFRVLLPLSQPERPSAQEAAPHAAGDKIEIRATLRTR